MQYFITLFSLLLFSACTSKVLHIENESDKPIWLLYPQSIGATRAIGKSRPSFRGMHIQRLNAMTQARAELSHSINTYITSKYSKALESSSLENSLHVKQQIKDNASALVKASYQVDAYVDEDLTLYILVAVDALKESEIRLHTLESKAFNNEALMKSHCYPQTVLASIKTRSRMYKNRPLWFYRPNDDGLAVMAIAEKRESQSFDEQKSVATLLASSNYSRKKSAMIDSKYESLKLLYNDKKGGYFESSAHTKSSNKVEKLHLKDIWMDENNCDLYVWMSP